MTHRANFELVFIGGIHCVGKSTFAKNICEKNRIQYLSASTLLKESDKRIDDSASKKVTNISSNQDKLICALYDTAKDGKKYLLDGHYCLLNAKNIIEEIPLSIFEKISPISLNIIIEKIKIIKDRLEDRDKILYNYDLLSLMQEKELHHAEFIANSLSLPLNIAKYDSGLSLSKTITNSFNYL